VPPWSIVTREKASAGPDRSILETPSNPTNAIRRGIAGLGPGGILAHLFTKTSAGNPIKTAQKKLGVEIGFQSW